MNRLVGKVSVSLLVITAALVFSCLPPKGLAADGEMPVFKYEIPMEGNGWITTNPSANRSMITPRGLVHWTDNSDVVCVFVKPTITGTMNLGLKARCSSGTSVLKVSIGRQSYIINVASVDYKTINIGTFKVAEPGYQKITIEALSKAGDIYADISSLMVGGPVCESALYFVKDDFYWGRRGPSVHLNYQLPDNAGDIKWFYNEVTIPEGCDVVGSYFMANGFGEGYFGIQVNSETERRVLFSVWSPFNTDDPKAIPEDQKIVLLKKGDDVRTGEFGNEGSGGQSYRIFNWSAGVTYKFLLKAEPSVNNSTDYTAYFMHPGNGDWELMASFRRPHTTTYIKHTHSFLENFLTNSGAIERKGMYGNQWVCNTKGEWFELTKARFSADATARKESRMDYGGGVEDGRFYMKNCGFFSVTTPIGSMLEREPAGKVPAIDFEKLP